MKKEFDSKKILRGKNISDQINDIENLEKRTQDAIEEAIENPNKENLINAVEIIKNDNMLNADLKDSLIKQLQKDYFVLFNPNNCPDDYEELKKEAKFLSGMTQYSFLLMAQRLKKIRDNKLYEQDNYIDFKSFIDNELTISKRTVYDYIDIISFFGVRAPALDGYIEYSKLSAIIPLLKSDNPKIPKDKIIDKYLKEINIKSFREIRKEVNDLKTKYGLIKKEHKTKHLQKDLDSLFNKIPEKIDDYDKVIIEKFIKKLQKKIQ